MGKYTSLKTKLGNLPLSRKILIIAVCILFVRLGSVIPLPFVNRDYMQVILGGSDGGLGFFNAVTGGALYQMSFFALSISPYITASIIIQLLSITVPKLEKLRKEGKSGEDTYKKITNITGIVLAFFQASGMAIGLGAGGLLTPYNPLTVIGAIAIWTTGAAVLILMGEMITKMNIGNGISILLVTNILATIPGDVRTVTDVLIQNHIPAVMILRTVIVAATCFAVICGGIVLTQTYKKIRVTQSRKMSGQADTVFPIPLNVCSVMPVIFASSIMSMPILISRFVPAMTEGIVGKVISALNTSAWFNVQNPLLSLGAVLYVGLSIFFAYFYLGIGFNAAEIADNFKKSGTVIPGIRPGVPTEEYIEKVSTKIAMAGNAFMVALIIGMHAICNVSGLGTLSIAGTSILICISVIMEEKKTISALAKLKSYKKAGFLYAASKTNAKTLKACA